MFLSLLPMKQLQRELLSTGGGITSISNRLSRRIYNGKLFIPESRRLVIRLLYPGSPGVFRWNDQGPKLYPYRPRECLLRSSLEKAILITRTLFQHPFSKLTSRSTDLQFSA